MKFWLIVFITMMVIFNNTRLRRIESKIDSFSSPSSETRAEPKGESSGFIADNGAGLSPPPPQKRSDFTTKTCPYFEVTAYCPCEKCCGRWADGYTASGHKIVQGDRFVAAPPDIPFGTLLAINGYAGGLPVPVRDRGGAIQGNKLDVFFGGENGHQEALNWGRRKMKVKILKR